MPNGLYFLWAFSLLTYRLETNYHGRTQTQSSFIIALTSHLFWLGLRGRDFTALQCWNHVWSLTEHALDGESVHCCYVVFGRKVVCSLQSCHSSLLKWTVILFPSRTRRAAAHSTSRSLGSHARFLGSSFPSLGLELPLYFFFIIIILFPPAYCFCTLIPAIFIPTARLLIKAREMLVWKMEMVHERGAENSRDLLVIDV